MKNVYVGIGSNLDEPLLQAEQALMRLTMLPETRFIKASSYYLSEPMGPEDQPDYVNLVAKLETQLKPLEFLQYCQAIEQGQGRVRGSLRWGPRRIDVDILLYGDEIITTEELTVPHYAFKERDFVVVPMMEIEPELVLPTGETLKSIYQSCPKHRLEKLANKHFTEMV